MGAVARAERARDEAASKSVTAGMAEEREAVLTRTARLAATQTVPMSAVVASWSRTRERGSLREQRDSERT